MCLLTTLEDMPTTLPSSCSLGAISVREDPRDAFVAKARSKYTEIQSLPHGAVVGTSSVRRSSQLLRLYPHFKFAEVRGNLNTRLSKLDDENGKYDCLILAAAGLKRIGLQDRITQYLDPENGGMLYAVGQGALGLEIRNGDDEMLELVKKLEDRGTALACLAERSLLRTLEGGCSVPIGVETSWVGEESDGLMNMKAIVVSLNGKESVESHLQSRVDTADEAEGFGKTLAQQLIDLGATKILHEIEANK